MSETIIKRTNMRMGGSVALGVTIDPFLGSEDTQTLYDRWKAEDWGDLLVFRGGQTAITCEMVQAVPLDQLTSTYGKKLALRLVEASNNAVL